jgi:hypothetical protein
MKQRALGAIVSYGQIHIKSAGKTACAVLSSSQSCMYQLNVAGPGTHDSFAVGDRQI